MLFYTDGLIERRFKSTDVGFDRLVAAMRAPSSSVEALSDRVLRQAEPPNSPDDIALVAIERTSARPPGP